MNTNFSLFGGLSKVIFTLVIIGFLLGVLTTVLLTPDLKNMIQCPCLSQERPEFTPLVSAATSPCSQVSKAPAAHLAATQPALTAQPIEQPELAELKAQTQKIWLDVIQALSVVVVFVASGLAAVVVVGAFELTQRKLAATPARQPRRLAAKGASQLPPAQRSNGQVTAKAGAVLTKSPSGAQSAPAPSPRPLDPRKP